jgi:hypothetical protein
MTEQAFITLHRNNLVGNINFPNRININYDVTGPGTGRITGVSITNRALQGSTVPELGSTLSKLTSIRFKIDNVPFTLIALSRSRYLSTPGLNGSDFYYYRVVPVDFTLTDADGYISDVQVTIAPYTGDILFENSDYNPFIGDTQELRQSKTIFKADRGESAVIPTNFESILDGTATYADIQDSNYTTTGWSNARYNGTKTSVSNYGVTPVLIGRTVQGEVNTTGSAKLTICSRSLADRVVEPIFHTGNTELPRYEEARTRYKLASAMSTGITTLDYLYGFNASSASIEVGNIIRIITPSGDPGYGNEYMRVKEIFPNLNKMEVERAYKGLTPALLHNSSDVITVVLPVNLYQFDESGVNFITVANSQVWIKDSQDILKTDIYGVVYTSSSCEA